MSKEKEKVESLSCTVCKREPKMGIKKFLTLEATTRYFDIISHQVLFGEWPVKLDDFSGFKLITLVQNCGWKKMVEKPYPVYEILAREFYANFNSEMNTLGSQHLHQTWVRDKWIMFSPIISCLGTMWSQSQVTSIRTRWPMCCLGLKMHGHYKLLSGIKSSLHHPQPLFGYSCATTLSPTHTELHSRIP